MCSSTCWRPIRLCRICAAVKMRCICVGLVQASCAQHACSFTCAAAPTAMHGTELSARRKPGTGFERKRTKTTAPCKWDLRDCLWNARRGCCWDLSHLHAMLRPSSRLACLDCSFISYILRHASALNFFGLELQASPSRSGAHLLQHSQQSSFQSLSKVH